MFDTPEDLKMACVGAFACVLVLLLLLLTIATPELAMLQFGLYCPDTYTQPS